MAKREDGGEHEWAAEEEIGRQGTIIVVRLSITLAMGHAACE